jgi:hypothetical protein
MVRPSVFLLAGVLLGFVSACSSNSPSAAAGEAGAEGGGAEVSGTADTFAWAESFQAGSGSQIMAMASDASGVVIAGQMVGTATFGATTLTGNSGSSGDGFIAKLDPAGNVLWAQVTSGSSSDFEALTIDSSGNIIVSGEDFGTASTMTLGGTTLTPETGSINARSITEGGGTIFKLDPSGNVVWGKLVATTGEINMSSLAISGTTIFASGAIIDDAAFASGGAMAITNCGTAGCVFLAAYDESGNVQWAEQAPSSPHRGTGVDPREVWLAANSTDLYLAIGGDYSSAGGLSNDTMQLVVNQYDLTGAVTWTKPTPAQDSPMVSGIALDASGNAFVVGASQGLQLGTVSIVGSQGATATFIAKYSPTGDVAWTTGSNQGDKAGATLANTALALSDHLYIFGNGGDGSSTPSGATGMVVDVVDEATDALTAQLPCGAAHGLGNAASATSAGVYIGGYGGPPAQFGSRTISALGLFVAKLK